MKNQTAVQQLNLAVLEKPNSQITEALFILMTRGKLSMPDANKRGMMRLSSIIHKLKHKHLVPITTIPTKGKNKYGETMMYATYKLIASSHKPLRKVYSSLLKNKRK